MGCPYPALTKDELYIWHPNGAAHGRSEDHQGHHGVLQWVCKGLIRTGGVEAVMLRVRRHGCG